MQYMGGNLKNDRKTLVHFQGKPFNITVIQLYAPKTNAKEVEVAWFCEDLQDLLELTQKKTKTKKKMSFSSQGTRMHKQKLKRYLE